MGRGPVRVAVCSVGDELLSGDVVDTNAAWLAARVRESGGRVVATLVVGDRRDAIVQALSWLAPRTDVLVVSGGLGPTPDDLTRDAVADFAGVGLQRRPDLVAHLEQVYARLERAVPDAARHQADVPVPATVHAPAGTAAGFTLTVAVEGRSVPVHVLPGVPWEYRDLADRVLLPDLVRRSGGRALVTRTVHVAGLGESGVGDRLTTLTDRLVDDADVEVGFLATDDEVLVRVTAAGASPAAARDRAAVVVDEVTARLGVAVTSVDERRLEDEVARLLEASGATVASAEGATAGRLATALADPPGAATRVAGGVVAPTAAGLRSLLDVDTPDADAGALVAPAVVGAMAQRVRDRLRADWGVAVAVVADGPDVGTAVWAVATPDGTVHVEERHVPAADRDLVRVRGAAFALEALRRRLATAGADTAAAVTP